jgi:hypothetical protein
MMVFVVPAREMLTLNEESMRQHFLDIRAHVGDEGKYGRVGLSFNFPYTSIVEGTGPKNFRLRQNVLEKYELATRVASRLHMPVMVCFNGAVWANSDGAFNRYWKTVDGGKYLSRYSDGRVNESIPNDSGPIPISALEPYLLAEAGSPDYLNLTLSPCANDLQASRLDLLQKAALFWRDLNQKYPQTIRALTTDSEVSFFPFRRTALNKPLQIGYEDWIVSPFCKKENLEPTKFSAQLIEDDQSLSSKWHAYRSKIVHEYIAVGFPLLHGQ